MAVENGKNEIIEILNSRATTKGKAQRFDTMMEQIDIRKAQISQRLLHLKSEEEEQKKLLSQIIDEVNALYDKDYEPDFTTKAAMQIRDLLLKNATLKERLEKSAKNNTS